MRKWITFSVLVSCDNRRSTCSLTLSWLAPSQTLTWDNNTHSSNLNRHFHLFLSVLYSVLQPISILLCSHSVNLNHLQGCCRILANCFLTHMFFPRTPSLVVFFSLVPSSWSWHLICISIWPQGATSCANHMNSPLNEAGLFKINNLVAFLCTSPRCRG